MTRREFASTIAAISAAAPARAATLPMKKGMLIGMLPKDLGVREKFQLAKDSGFEVMECQTVTDAAEAAEIKKASEAVGMPIHSVMNMAHWANPLSSPDPAVVEKGMAGMRTSLENAKLWGADSVLLVPAVVTEQVGYQDAWTRSQRKIRELLPMAEKLKVTIGIENVWNKFLLSPLEMARYVDEFESPWVKAYFDVGNMVLFGFPQDWIRTLGAARITKVHFKDFKFARGAGGRTATFPPLREGDIDWKEVHKAFLEIGYKGVVTVELPGGDAAYYKEVSRRVDLILAGA